MYPLRALAVFFVRLYQCCISSLHPPCCRFRPTCSAYALEALREHGFLTACRLILWRIARCHPWADGGYDPVPPAILRQHKD